MGRDGASGKGRKRGRDDDDDGDAGSKRKQVKQQKRPRGEGAAAGSTPDQHDEQQGGEGRSIGMQTSHIKNKLVRAQLYQELKRKQEVRGGSRFGRARRRVPGTGRLLCTGCCPALGSLQRVLMHTWRERASHAAGARVHGARHTAQKAKKKAREKRDKAEKAAIAQGLEPPPRKQTKVRAVGGRASEPGRLLRPCSSGHFAPPLPTTQTIENQRVKDETMVEEGDQEVEADEQMDEFAGEAATRWLSSARRPEGKGRSGGCA